MAWTLSPGCCPGNERFILTTSRERLHLQGEWVYEVNGLDVPASDATDSFEGYGSVDLFGERLRQVRPRTPLRHEERPTVVRICHLVEDCHLPSSWQPPGHNRSPSSKSKTASARTSISCPPRCAIPGSTPEHAGCVQPDVVDADTRNRQRIGGCRCSRMVFGWRPPRR